MVLAGHVVSTGSNRPQRRSAEDVLGVGKREQIGEVGVTAGKLADTWSAIRPLEFARQESGKALDIDDLVGSDVNQIGRIHRFQGRQLTSGHVANSES